MGQATGPAQPPGLALDRLQLAGQLGGGLWGVYLGHLLGHGEELLGQVCLADGAGHARRVFELAAAMGQDSVAP